MLSEDFVSTVVIFLRCTYCFHCVVSRIFKNLVYDCFDENAY
jgi:hypothetical protein